MTYLPLKRKVIFKAENTRKGLQKQIFFEVVTVRTPDFALH